uniref:Repressor protein n=1 Tax=Siphoviridae sp. ctXBp18 TaxID=2825541 RepID=A0A8S5PK07_9CAUD|nr:MAG TPA: repressor protein [Siphoviridae sp. ctXBp18]
MSELYNRIESLCKKKNINVTTMCKETGASRGSLTDLKVGRKKKLSIDTLSKIAEYFGVSVDYLLNGNENITVEAHNDPVYIDDETREIIDSLRSRPEMKVLFSVSKNATKDDIEMAVDIIKKFKGDGE